MLSLSTKKILLDIKKRPPKKLDRIVQKIHEEVFSETDCLKCASCCKKISPILYRHDIFRIVKGLKISLEKFVEMYLTIDKDDDYVFKVTPCPFLEADNNCGIYDDRPTACRDYPHTDTMRFHQRIELSIKNAEYCPAVSQILEKLASSVEKDLVFRRK